MNSALYQYINYIKSDFKKINKSRKAKLFELSSYLIHKNKTRGQANLTFICTHNSRRSHLAQIWAATSASYYGLNNIFTYSGGTMVTRFNDRVIKTLKKNGFVINNPDGHNPHYLVSFSDRNRPLECFSKKYDSPFNPKKNFAAIMTCSNADSTCPYIPESEERILIPYDDPKVYDGTKSEEEFYQKSCKEIATEMLFCMKIVDEKKMCKNLN
tara:strand:- start:2220 stop:2858 length:639 start_codon:yes stop_codon:yes gene_type:complete